MSLEIWVNVSSTLSLAFADVSINSVPSSSANACNTTGGFAFGRRKHGVWHVALAMQCLDYTIIYNSSGKGRQWMMMGARSPNGLRLGTRLLKHAVDCFFSVYFLYTSILSSYQLKRTERGGQLRSSGAAAVCLRASHHSKTRTDTCPNYLEAGLRKRGVGRGRESRSHLALLEGHLALLHLQARTDTAWTIGSIQLISARGLQHRQVARRQA